MRFVIRKDNVGNESELVNAKTYKRRTAYKQNIQSREDPYLSNSHGSESVEGSSDSTNGVLRVGQTDLNCQLWLGERIEGAKPNSIVAVKTPKGWAAIESRLALGEPVYAIQRLNASPSTGARKSIAVLDDDVDLTNSICDYLTLSGYDARPFYKIADLSRRAAIQQFDGFIIDWIVDDANAIPPISALRARDEHCPIVVLTGEVASSMRASSQRQTGLNEYSAGSRSITFLSSTELVNCR